MWAKIITIKRTKDLNYFSLCALHLFNTQVSQFELNYWNKWTFPRHSNLLRCTCTRRKGSYCHEDNTRGELKQLQHTERNMKKLIKECSCALWSWCTSMQKRAIWRKKESSLLIKTKKNDRMIFIIWLGSKLFLCSCWTKKWNGA